jgi:hypothetical protein
MRSLALLSLATLAVTACAGHAAAPVDGGGGGSDATPIDPAALTYWNDIAPIINDKCVKCHQAGGIGPFALDSYQVVKSMAPTLASVVKVNYMPPFYITHDGSCGQFQDGDALTADQIARIDAWAGGDRKEGTPVTISKPIIPGITDGDAYSTPMIIPRAQGGALAMADEYRCFPVASKRDADAFITAYDVRPGNDGLVHHVIAMLVDPARKTRDGRTNAEVMKALDDADPDRPGWPCFSLAGDAVEVDAIPVIWAPGQGPVTYPGKVGVPHKKSHQLVIQVHYNLTDPKLAGMSDSTTIHFRYAPTVERRAFFVVRDPFLDTLSRTPPDTLPAGMPEAKYTWKKSAADLGIPAVAGVSLLGVMPHMHQRGLHNQLTITSGGGPSCAAEIKVWSFGWQKFYFYKGTPPVISPGSQFQMDCAYTTANDTMPVLPGWGTGNEMCTAIFMLALPPGM